MKLQKNITHILHFTQIHIILFSLFLFVPLDCDPNLKPSTTAELDHLVNRLERLLDRLERTVLARELNFASEALDLKQEAINSINSTSTTATSTVVTANNQKSINNQHNQKDREKDSNTVVTFTQKLEQRISELESNLERRLNQEEEFNDEEKEKDNKKEDINDYSVDNFDGDNIIIPTVVSQIIVENSISVSDSCNNGNIMSLNGYEDIILGYLNPFLELSKKIGSDVATQAELVKKAFE